MEHANLVQHNITKEIRPKSRSVNTKIAQLVLLFQTMVYAESVEQENTQVVIKRNVSPAQTSIFLHLQRTVVKSQNAKTEAKEELNKEVVSIVLKAHLVGKRITSVIPRIRMNVQNKKSLTVKENVKDALKRNNLVKVDMSESQRAVLIRIQLKPNVNHMYVIHSINTDTDSLINNARNVQNIPIQILIIMYVQKS